MAAYTTTLKMSTSSPWVSGPKCPPAPISGLLAISLTSPITTTASTNEPSARSAPTMRVTPRDPTAGTVGSLDTPSRFPARAGSAFRVLIPSRPFPRSGGLRCSSTGRSGNGGPLDRARPLCRRLPSPIRPLEGHVQPTAPGLVLDLDALIPESKRGGAAVQIEHRLAALENADTLNLADVHLPVCRVGSVPHCRTRGVQAMVRKAHQQE